VFFQIPSISSEELALPHLIRCELSLLLCHSHSLLLSSYLCRIKWKENSSYSAYRHNLQHLTHLLVHCPAESEPLRRAIFFYFDLWSRRWGSVEFLCAPISRKGSSSTTTILERVCGILIKKTFIFRSPFTPHHRHWHTTGLILDKEIR